MISPNVWGEGALFAFSGIDGTTDAASGFVGSLGAEPFDLLFHTPVRRVLSVRPLAKFDVEVVTGDVIRAGESAIAFTEWHSLAGRAPEESVISLQTEDGTAAVESGGVMLSVGGKDFLALRRRGERFALSHGRTEDEAASRSEAALGADLDAVIAARLAFLEKVPTLDSPGESRLLAKCASVMKVNTLAPEGVVKCRWSTPDRVPHKDFWLWDSVFHSLAMNHFDPALSGDFLAAVLDRQRDDGMISHQMRTAGWQSSMTQPPVLAWGVWENFAASGNREFLEEAFPRLERYLEWDFTNRDSNGNHLLEWLIEGDVKCRSGESGMDNSNRFDDAITLDAVDFSAYAAWDIEHLAKIADALGFEEKARGWRERGRLVSSAIHELLWSEEEGFYLDRRMDGALSPVKAVTGFLPLLLDDLPPARVDALAAALADPALFGSACPIPSLALDQPGWSTDMWRGPTWINTNYFVILGLRRQGRADLAVELRAKTIDLVMKYYERFGVTFEFFDSRDAVPPTQCERKGPPIAPYNIRRKNDSIRDYHWTAALTACLLLE